LNGPRIYLKLRPVAGVSKLGAALALALAAAPVTDEILRPEVARLVTAVSAARHLPFHGTLPARALPPDEARRAAALAVGEGMQNAASRTEDEILRRLGLVPAGIAPGAAAAEAYALGAPPAARYDAATGTLLVPSTPPLAAQQAVLAHEIAHAVADQRFGLRRFLGIGPEGAPRMSGDAERARLAVVEGDAMLSALELADPKERFLGPYALGALAAELRRAARGDSPADSTSWFTDLGVFTHVDGLLFVARVRAHRPWSAVDALWKTPPDSTEQVLHPEKFDDCEAPVAVDEAALPALAGFGHPAGSAVMGELVVRSWLGAALPAELAARAAAGWGGDRAGLYAPAPGPSSQDGGAARDGGVTTAAPLGWLTVWDDAGEASDFALAAEQLLVKMSGRAGSGQPGPNRPSDERAIFESPDGAFGLARRADAVALLFAAPPPIDGALDAMLEAVRPRANRRAAPRPRRAAQPGCPRRDRAAGSG
jgi:hypothetical protein